MLYNFGILSKKYYLVTGNTVLNEAEYKNFKDSVSVKGKLTEKIALVFKKNDSTFVLPHVEVRSTNSVWHYFNDQIYFEQTFKKNINFTNLKIIRLNKRIDPAKPYFVSCWFVNCNPCTSEIPDLNNLQKEYKDKVNFIAVTFDKGDFLKQFLQKTPYHFIHLTDQKPLLEKMEISSYPTSFILDKNGNFIRFVSYHNAVSQMYTKKVLDQLEK
nr:TlpA disulfide reductase family protein [Chryseobacterium gilvum]